VAKRCEIGRRLLLITNRKSHTLFSILATAGLYCSTSLRLRPIIRSSAAVVYISLGLRTNNKIIVFCKKFVAGKTTSFLVASISIALS